MKKKIHISQNFSESIPSIFINDSNKYRQIIVALVSNSLKFTCNGSIKFEVKYHNDDNCLMTTIEDSGIGMNKDKLSKILIAFSKVDEEIYEPNNNITGMGFGLVLSNALCQTMGGSKLEIISKENVGTKVTFYIKNLLNSLEDRGKTLSNINKDNHFIFSPSNQNNNESSKLILQEPISKILTPKLMIVDDIESNIFVLRSYSEKVGLNYDVAHNGLEALNLYKKSKKEAVGFEYKIVFMDINMPIMDGIEATKEIRKFEKRLYPPVTIIAITANMDKTIEQKCREAGINEFKAKPYSYAQFLSDIKFYHIY